MAGGKALLLKPLIAIAGGWMISGQDSNLISSSTAACLRELRILEMGSREHASG